MSANDSNKRKRLTPRQVEKVLKSASGAKDSAEKIIDAADKLLNYKGITSNPSKLGKVVGRIQRVFETAKEILKPLEAAIKAIQIAGVGLDVYIKSGSGPPGSAFWLSGYKKTHDRIQAMRSRLTRFAGAGLYLPAEVNYHYIFAKAAKPGGNQKAKLFRAGLTIIEDLEESVRDCKARIKLLKRYNQYLWNTSRLALKKERYATVLLRDHVDELTVVAIVLAAMQRKIDTISMSGVEYLFTFNEAKGDWGGLAQDCMKARARASKDIVAHTARLRRDQVMLKSMAESIRRRSTWCTPMSGSRVSANESRSPLGLNPN